ncbi:MAG TPA: ABC transporter permease [Hanamia sp.]
MFKNYFKITFRNFKRRRVYSIINILGFSLGLTAAAIVILYTRHELSFDNFHHHSKRIFQVSGKNQDTWFAPLFISYSDAIYQHTFPEVEMMARVRGYPPRFIHYQNNQFFEDKVLFTDPGTDFFNLFNFHFINGSPDAALRQPNSAVITASIAQKFFGNENPIGKLLVFDSLNLSVTGVIQNLPSNTNFDFNILISNEKIMEAASTLDTYCLLGKNANINHIKNEILNLPKPSDQFKILTDAAIIPLDKLHFETGMTYGMKPPASKIYLVLFNLIGFIIVILSCTNYMNLSIALYSERKKEIAIRKVLGAANVSLAMQFFVDAICMALISIPLTLGLLELILPQFNQFMNVQLQNEFIKSLPGFSVLLGVILLVGIVSGSYPAWVLPKLKTVSLFKKESVISRQGISLRQVLITFQITILILISSVSWIVYNQLQYVQQKNLGFNKENIVKLTGAYRVDSEQYYRLKNELLLNPDIKNVSQGLVPGDENYAFSFKGARSDVVYNDLFRIGTDYSYLNTLGLKLLQDDFNDKNRPKRLTLINETLSKRLGYPNPIGKTITISPGKNEKTYTINGVVNDFNFFSLHQPVTPIVLNIYPFGNGIDKNILIKIQTKNLSKTLNFIKKKVSKIIPDIPLTMKFLDDDLNKLYDKEQKFSILSEALLLITLFLSVIGLIGLSAYMATLRTKEIGIRKVLGAGVNNIVLLLFKDFIMIVIIAIIVATPIGWWAMNKWLEGFAYRINISWWVFALAGVLALFIALITVSFQAIKAAVANPVDSLRSE